MASYDIKDMIGKTPIRIEQTDDEIDFYFSDGSRGKFYHEQDCCEHVDIEDVNGDWKDLIGNPILIADERISFDDTMEYESNTWTFYTFRGIGGSVDVRWHGSSNGFYSEGVDFWMEKADV